MKESRELLFDKQKPTRPEAIKHTYTNIYLNFMSFDEIKSHKICIII